MRSWILYFGLTVLVLTACGGIGSGPETAGRKPLPSGKPSGALRMGGNGVGNGGDPELALSAGGLARMIAGPEAFLPGAVAQYREDFFVMGSHALWAILRELENGTRFESKEGQLIPLTAGDVYEGLGRLKAICVDHPERFGLSRELKIDGDKEVTAANYSDGTIRLNPGRWDAIGKQYPASLVPLVKGVVASHEILSLIAKHLEHTGYYPVSSTILKLSLDQYPDGEGFRPRLLSHGQALISSSRYRFLEHFRREFRQLTVKLEDDSRARDLREWDFRRLEALGAEYCEILGSTRAKNPGDLPIGSDAEWLWTQERASSSREGRVQRDLFELEKTLGAFRFPMGLGEGKMPSRTLFSFGEFSQIRLSPFLQALSDNGAKTIRHDGETEVSVEGLNCYDGKTSSKAGCEILQNGAPMPLSVRRSEEIAFALETTGWNWQAERPGEGYFLRAGSIHCSRSASPDCPVFRCSIDGYEFRPH